MAEQIEATTEFNKAHDLAERIYNLQADQTSAMMRQLIDQGNTLVTMKIDVALVKSYTEGLPARVLALENLRYKGMAFIAAWMFLLLVVQFALPYLKH